MLRLLDIELELQNQVDHNLYGFSQIQNLGKEWIVNGHPAIHLARVVISWRIVRREI